jgi:hypothetical protein
MHYPLYDLLVCGQEREKIKIAVQTNGWQPSNALMPIAAESSPTPSDDIETASPSPTRIAHPSDKGACSQFNNKERLAWLKVTYMLKMHQRVHLFRRVIH